MADRHHVGTAAITAQPSIQQCCRACCCELCFLASSSGPSCYTTRASSGDKRGTHSQRQRPWTKWTHTRAKTKSISSSNSQTQLLCHFGSEQAIAGIQRQQERQRTAQMLGRNDRRRKVVAAGVVERRTTTYQRKVGIQMPSCPSRTLLHQCQDRLNSMFNHFARFTPCHHAFVRHGPQE